MKLKLHGVLQIKKTEDVKKSGEIQRLNVEGRKITDQQTIAENCNEYFVFYVHGTVHY